MQEELTEYVVLYRTSQRVGRVRGNGRAVLCVCRDDFVDRAPAKLLRSTLVYPSNLAGVVLEKQESIILDIVALGLRHGQVCRTEHRRPGNACAVEGALVAVILDFDRFWGAELHQMNSIESLSLASELTFDCS